MAQPKHQPGEMVFAEAFSPSYSSFEGYRLNHAGLRTTNPERTKQFYGKVMGMSLLFEVDIGPMTVLFFGYPEKEDKVPQDIVSNQWARTGLVEFLYYHEDTSLSTSTRGKSQKWHGHLGFVVPNLEEALERAEQEGATIIKRPLDTAGNAIDLRSSDPDFHPDFAYVWEQVAFLADPDGGARTPTGENDAPEVKDADKS